MISESEALRRIEREVKLNWGSPSVSERVLLHILDTRREVVTPLEDTKQ